MLAISALRPLVGERGEARAPPPISPLFYR